MDIYHIYWGTSGSAGLYLDEIYKTLECAGLKQKAFVSYYYPFSYGEKVFFKISDFEHCKFKGFIRKLLMGAELAISFIRILFSSIKDKPKLINYSYVSVGSLLVYFFLKVILKLNRNRCKLVITCHDVEPNVHNKTRYNKELRIKAKIYGLADYYLIHNPNSKDDLHRLFGIDNDRIVKHLFPIMDLSKLDAKVQGVVKKYDFLFIGHMRKEKGVDLLIETWFDFHNENPSATLCIAGNPAYYKSYIENHLTQCKKCNVTFYLGFVKDEDYIQLVKESCCVVFPYTSGTNSGVISTVLSLRREVIVSDLSMFINNPLVSNEFIFKCGEKESLKEKLTYCYLNKSKLEIDDKIKKYRKVFGEQVVNVYFQMLNNS